MAGLMQQQPMQPQQPAAESGEEAPNVSAEEQNAYNSRRKWPSYDLRREDLPAYA